MAMPLMVETLTGILDVQIDTGPEGRFIYETQYASPDIQFNDATRAGRISDYGTFDLNFMTDFKLAVPAIGFPKGQPENVTWVQSDASFTVTIDVPYEGVKYPQIVEFLVHRADGAISDPTILVDPPNV
ncbi:MAG TPA: hypothetical protein VGS22_25625 [Thermoanaerobaculia bacterium]|jgi:hypothetical protein|nr:hypothetical protein [Thermoanaerobaculia bacterium]